MKDKIPKKKYLLTDKIPKAIADGNNNDKVADEGQNPKNNCRRK